MSAYQARLEEHKARRANLAAKLERLAAVAAQTAQELRGGTDMNLDHIRRLEGRIGAIWEAVRIERAARP